MVIHAPAFSRRRFLRAIGQGALLAALPGRLLADQSAVTISILHTTDLHGHILPTSDYDGHPNLGGLARCATQIRQWRTANPNSLLLDIGDVYQGTEIGLQTRGSTMIRCLNSLNYDAWVVGNHEFDWGMEPLMECIQLSAMPVLSGNALVAGKAAGTLDIASGPLAKIQPWLMKDIAGFRIAIVGLTTPALSTWLPPENLSGFESLDPIESLRKILREVKTHKSDAIILAGHMGLIRQDNVANPVGALAREFPELTAFIGGHTHQNHARETIHGILYTQADHYGIYAGKIDLTFDPATRRLLRREAITVPMDHAVALDPLILAATQKELNAADLALARAIGELTETLGIASAFGKPSDTERLIGSAMRASLRKQGCEIDAVIHGLFDDKHPLTAGPKTVADAWNLLPYENQIVTIDLSRTDLIALIESLGSSGNDFRNVMGLHVEGVFEANRFSVTDLRAADGSPLPAKSTYRIALNSFDSQSAGGRFPLAARLASRPSSNRILHSIYIREALVDFFVSRGKVSRASLLV